MSRRRRSLRALLCPPGAVMALLVPLSAAGLAAVFVRGLEDTALAYAVYAVSAYTTMAAVAWLAWLWKKGRALLHKNAFFHRYLTDLAFKAEVSLHISFGVTLFYCVYKAAAGLYYRSAWLGSMAFYYFVLGAVRFQLLRHVRGGRGTREQALQKYRFCGYLLLVLTLALGLMSFYTIYEGRAVEYPGYIIYAAAGYAFYSLTMAVCNLARYRKLQNPVYSAAKALALAAALVSIFFLQASMFAAFGDGGAWQRQMSMATGGCVFLLIALMALFMIRRGARLLRDCSQGREE
nr:hypothetical protein [uncultured Oscillibacter sp.]